MKVPADRLNALKQATIEDDTEKVVLSAVRAGFAVVLVRPGQKDPPICTWAPSFRKGGKQYRPHDCGHYHAITEERAVARSVKYAQEQYPGQRLNIAIQPKLSNIMVVDVDTAGELDAFVRDPSWNGSRPAITVRSPGVERNGEWIHSGGGHVYFDASGIDIPESFTEWKHPEHKWLMKWSGYVVAPPSVRPEGPYTFSHPILLPLPQWMIDLAVKGIRAPKDRSELKETDLDQISQDKDWSEFLEPDGWVETGSSESCGCPKWWLPPRASMKTATAHYEDCFKYPGLLHIWSDALPDFLEGRGKNFTKLQYIAFRDHHGDMKAAMQSWGIEPHGKVELPELEPFVPQATAPEPLTLIHPDSLWEDYKPFEHIRQAAYAQGGSPDATLLAVLVRLASMVPPSTRLHTGIGGPSGCTLNLFGINVGPSGGTKSISARLAKDLLPDIGVLGERDYMPIGSGEGIAEAYMTHQWVDDLERGLKKDETYYQLKIKVKRHDNALFYVDEGEALTKLVQRNASTLGETLRRAFADGDLGQVNASAETTRRVKGGEYSLGLLIGFQPGTALPVLEDVGPGTPQRFMWASPIDPHRPHPDQAPHWPGALSGFELDGMDAARISPETAIHLPAEAKAELRNLHHLQSTGAVVLNEMDSHAGWIKARLCALIALLEHRYEPTKDDWARAQVIWETSCRVRASVVEYGTSTAKAKAREQINSHVLRTALAASRVREDEQTERETKIEDVAKRCALLMIEKGEGDPQTTGWIRRQLKQSLRQFIDDALEVAQERDWLQPDGDKWVLGGSRPS